MVVMKSCKSILRCKFVFTYTFVFIYLVFAAGCVPELSTTGQLKRFHAAGPITPQVDVNRLLNAKIHTGYYRVIPGDILELQMPAVLRVVSPDMTAWFRPTSGHGDIEPNLFRVSDAGIISLPIVGKLPVSGLTLTEIEILIVNAYYPRYVENIPPVICKVKEYQTQNITVLGGVVRPGLYKLNSDEMSLVSALMKAGGIIEEGASLITIRHSGHSDEPVASKSDIKSAYVFHPKNATAERSSQASQGSKSPAKKKHLTVTTQSKVIYSSEMDFATPEDRHAVKKKCEEFAENDKIAFFFYADDLSNTTGNLAVSMGKNVLYSSKIDIAGEKDKTTFATELVKNHPAIQLSYVMQEIERIVENNAIEQMAQMLAQSNISEFQQDMPGAQQSIMPRKDDYVPKPIVLPVKDLNIPFADVVLHDGDTIRVEKLNPEVFTVLGPVTKPGVFPYPPDVEYNLMQSLAFAGGLDLALNPRYVSIYRQDADGQIVSATFRIDDKSLAGESGILIKPGDVISVEMTTDVRTRLILREMLSIRFSYNLKDLTD